MREDIVAGLKKALERGVPLEKAVQSFVNAGYNPVEVKQAAQSLSSGIDSIANFGAGESPIIPFRKDVELRVPVKAQMHVLSSKSQIGEQQNRMIQSSMQTAQAYSPQNFAPRRLNEFKSMQQPKKNTGLIIALIIILLLLVGGLIYLIFFGQELIDSLLGSP